MISARRGIRILRDVDEEDGTAEIEGVVFEAGRAEDVCDNAFVGTGADADVDAEGGGPVREVADFLGARLVVGGRMGVGSFSSFFVRGLPLLGAEGGVSMSIGAS